MEPDSLEKNILCYGEEKGPSDALNLESGPVDLVFGAGALRYLKVGPSEVLRMIYFAVRDHNWDTIEGEISDLVISEETGRFRIEYTSVHQKDPVNISFRCLISGDERGHISFSIEGKAYSTFRKNRIGFCVLHPITECMGKPCTIEDQRGHSAIHHFPVQIAPHQPFKNIKAMEWQVNAYYKAKIAFTGDVFETEDQRNWTDASYKTYCTPLEIPFPVKIRAGESVLQKVELEIIPVKTDLPSEPESEKVLTFSIGEETGFSLPRLGCGASSVYEGLDSNSLEKIKALQLDHVRWDLELWKGEDLLQKIRSIQQEVVKLKITAFLALFFGEDPEEEYMRLVRALKKYPFPVRYILLFSGNRKTTTDKLINSLAHRVRKDFPEVLLGGGTNAYFAELNREPIDPRSLDFVAYSINPQVHAFDHVSMTETLEAQSQTVKSALSFTEGRDIIVSPVTLKPRFNPNATGEEPPPWLGELPAQVDVRQMSLYGACWTLISLKYLAESGVKTITYYETAGWKGLIQGMEAPPLQSKFNAEAGDIFPVYILIRWLNAFKMGRMLRSVSSRPLVFDGLTIRQHGVHHIFLANFSGEIQNIHIGNTRGPFLVRSLSIENIKKLMKDERAAATIQSVEVNDIIMEPCSIHWINLKNELTGL